MLPSVFNFVNNPDPFAYQLTANKEGNYLDGVSTLDLVMIQRHILGLAAFDNAYKVVASDINNDEKVSASDLLVLRKLILGIIDEFPDNESYRFISAAQTFNTITFPWPLEEDITIDPLHNDMVDQDFKAVKIGDVNGNANYGMKSNIISETRSDNNTLFVIDDTNLVAGEEYTINIYAGDNTILSGFQAAINLDGLKDVKVLPGKISIDNQNIAVSIEGLNISWTSIQNVEIERGDVLFTITGTASKLINVGKALIINESSHLTSETYNDKLEISSIEIKTREVGEVSSLDLYQNEPNPFRDQTIIGFNLPTAGSVQINIVDIAGKLLLSEAKFAKKGSNTFLINGESLGQSGVYYYTIITGESTQTKKMIFVK